MTTAPRVTSYHEAGHTVIASALGLHVDHVRIDDADSDDAGHTAYTGAVIESCSPWLSAYAAVQRVSSLATLLPPPGLSTRQREVLDVDITVACAGYAAESIHLGRRPSWSWHGRDCSDRLDAEGAASMLGHSLASARAIVAERRKLATEMLESRRPSAQLYAGARLDGPCGGAGRRAAQRGSSAVVGRPLLPPWERLYWGG